VLTIGDETIIAVTVLSGSGAKYAGQHYVWWTKGAHADLYDLTKGEDAPPLSCAAAG
jgi:membrane-bound inhibitor of C-type lysozyme